MPLDGKVENGLDAVFRATGIRLSGDELRAARLMWLDGYAQGMRVVETLTKRAFDDLAQEMTS